MFLCTPFANHCWYTATGLYITLHSPSARLDGIHRMQIHLIGIWDSPDHHSVHNKEVKFVWIYSLGPRFSVRCPYIEGVQPPPQALRFSHDRGQRETRVTTGDEPHGKGTDSRRSASRPLSPSRLPLRAHRRETSGYEAGGSTYYRDCFLKKIDENFVGTMETVRNREVSRTERFDCIWYIGLKFSKITEIFILFHYLRISIF